MYINIKKKKNKKKKYYKQKQNQKNKIYIKKTMPIAIDPIKTQKNVAITVPPVKQLCVQLFEMSSATSLPPDQKPF